jgi:hypothetical protein
MHESTLLFKPLHNFIFFKSIIDIKKISDENCNLNNAHGFH